MSNSESGLDKLWEKDTKVFGFALAIPEPEYLYHWAQATSKARGDSPEQQLRLHGEEQLTEFLLGKSSRSRNHQKLWTRTIQDNLISFIECEFNAGYSPRSGPWSNMNFSITAVNSAINKAIWKIPAGFAQIQDELNSQGLITTNSLDKDKRIKLEVSNNKDIPPADIYLGYKSIKEMKKADIPGNYYQPEIDQELDLDQSKFLKGLQLFQYTASYFVDACYKIAGLYAPNITLELSKAKELV